MKVGYTLGIDLGTTNSVAAVWRDGRPQVLAIQNQMPRELLRSAVFIESSDIIHVGEAAWNRRHVDPTRFISSVKSKMGTDHVYTVDGIEYTPEQISSFILREIIGRATKSLNSHGDVEVRNLVVTVPARFSPKALKATADAITMAGYPAGDPSQKGTHTLLKESDAAAYAYLRDNPRQQKVLVYDLGGGTFDITLMEFIPTPQPARINVLGPADGDPRLGGDVFDQRLLERMVVHFNTGGGEPPDQLTYPAYLDVTSEAPEGVDHSQWLRSRQLLWDEARRFKEVLCDSAHDESFSHEVTLPELMDRIQPAPFNMTLGDFHMLISDTLDETQQKITNLMDELDVVPGDVDRVILAGGSSRIPAIKTRLHDLFGFAPYDTMEPDKAIAIGAVIYDKLRLIVDPNDMPPQYVTVPIGLKITRIERESVIGDIGHEWEVNNSFAEVIPRGTKCPGSTLKTVTTVRDNQRTMRFQIYQQDGEKGGGSCNPSDFMGWFELTLPDAARGPKGVPQVDITFDVNADGYQLDVSAVEQRTGQKVESTFHIAQRGVELPPEESGSGMADIVVAMDTTDSMGPYIDEMKRHTRAFAAKVGDSGIDYRLALIDYRDLKFGERMTVYPFTGDVAEFQRRVDKMRPGGGRDIPESTLDAIEKALDLDYRDGAQKILIVITDAPSHDPGMSGISSSQIANRAKQQGAALYVISQKKLRSYYGGLIDQAQNGRFYEIGQSFDDILANVASEIRDITLV